MATIEESLAWTGVPVPDALGNLGQREQDTLAEYIQTVVTKKTDGLDELYQAISAIVKFIPHFIVIPLMVENIRPQISAGVCKKMGVDQAVNYANDLPVEYFSEVSRHIDDEMMARILEKMKRHHAEKIIKYELQNNQHHMLDIAGHFEQRLLEFVARNIDFAQHPECQATLHKHCSVIERMRALV
ncbi:MAG: hypothetical protein HGB00_02130 [Chlorobiaceae bacterium]|nr:hypothetical protein [Chlorobiaceae bacterium]